MNIVHVVDNLDRGGAQTMLQSLVAGLCARGYEQHVICLNEKFSAQVVESIRQAGASVEIIGRPRMFATAGFWRIVRELRRRRPDLVHTEMPWGDLIGRAAARLAGIRPVVSTVTARYADKPRLQLMFDRATAGWADRVVFQSAEIVAFSIEREGVRPDQVQCIPNGVEPDDRDRSEAAGRLRREFGGGARTVIGMVARLHPQKAHADLLEAFARLAPAATGTRLWLIGDGPERGRLDALAQRRGLEEHVVFAGERADVRDWIAAMDLFVHPTHFEGLPLAVLEAMDAAKPVIATRVDGLEGLITPGVHGWLVPPGDVEALTGTIRRVMDHPEEAARVAHTGQERVRSEFSAARAVQAYDALFRSLAPARGRPAAASGPR